MSVGSPLWVMAVNNDSVTKLQMAIEEGADLLQEEFYSRASIIVDHTISYTALKSAIEHEKVQVATELSRTPSYISYPAMHHLVKKFEFRKFSDWSNCFISLIENGYGLDASSPTEDNYPIHLLATGSFSTLNECLQLLDAREKCHLVASEVDQFAKELHWCKPVLRIILEYGVITKCAKLKVLLNVRTPKKSMTPLQKVMKKFQNTQDYRHAKLLVKYGADPECLRTDPYGEEVLKQIELEKRCEKGIGKEECKVESSYI
ncbi:MAG: hypothetical protein H0W88_07840 [Parachlamydiaceae bacterium]|nr:hypothetical protein [Parachlamydiaceae bacterium]